MCKNTQENDKLKYSKKTARQLLDIEIVAVCDIWGNMPIEEQLNIIEVARSEINKLLQHGLPNLYTVFYHRLPCSGRDVFYIFGTGEEIQINVLQPDASTPNFYVLQG